MLGLLLHIRLCCCLIAQKITSAYLREQQIALYLLHLLIYLTITSIPFYFHRASEVLFDSQSLFEEHSWMNGCAFAQILLFGISFQPVLHAILFLPSRILLKYKCFTSVRLSTASNRCLISSNRSGCHMISIYPQLHFKLPFFSD